MTYRHIALRPYNTKSKPSSVMPRLTKARKKGKGATAPAAARRRLQLLAVPSFKRSEISWPSFRWLTQHMMTMMLEWHNWQTKYAVDSGRLGSQFCHLREIPIMKCSCNVVRSISLHLLGGTQYGKRQKGADYLYTIEDFAFATYGFYSWILHTTHLQREFHMPCMWQFRNSIQCPPRMNWTKIVALKPCRRFTCTALMDT